ncbi:hypothetical protein [Chryseobacterium salivictor]|nr:hypothetical protein [Chryseobacterium salivictor]
MVKKSTDIIVSIVAALLVSVVSYYLAITYFDLSYDGQGYHQETIYLLKNGWNPVYGETKAFRSWINYYQKGNEIIQSNIYLLTDKIEAGKMINVLFIYIALVTFFIFLSTLQIKHIYKWIITFIVVFNPVVFTQVFTNYLDANWYLTLVISLSSLLTYFSNRERLGLIIFILSSVIFCSLKLTSIPVFIVIAVFAFSYHLFFHKKKMIMPFLTVLLLSGICNVHPFLTNVQHGYHILHPFAGAKKSDILNQNIPEVLLNKNRVERILVSLFSESSNGTKAILYEGLKMPFEVNKANLYISYDTRLGGFGFLFSGIIVLTLLMFLCILFIKEEKFYKKILIIVLACIVSTIIVNPASWWARLSAQIWLLPITIIIFGLLSKKKLPKLLSQLSLFIFMLNILIPGYLNFNELQNNKKIMNQFVNSVGKKTIILDLSNKSGFQQYYLKFRERNIKYKLNNITDKSHLAPFTPHVYYEIE